MHVGQESHGPRLGVTIAIATLLLAGLGGAARGQDAGAARPAVEAAVKPAATAARPDPRELSQRFDRLYRAESSRGRMRMQVVTPHFERTLEMTVLSRGMDDTLVRITSPAKERGVATLKKGNEMWNFVPRVQRTVRIPPSMMMGSWMGSDFTNDDLMRATSWERDYDIAYDDAAAEGAELCLAYTPKPDAPVTWSKVVGCFSAEGQLPVRVDYFDERGRKARTLTYDDVGPLGGRTLPRRMTLRPLLDDKAGQRTVVEMSDMEFDVALSPADFSIGALQRPR